MGEGLAAGFAAVLDLLEVLALAFMGVGESPSPMFSHDLHMQEVPQFRPLPKQAQYFLRHLFFLPVYHNVEDTVVVGNVRRM